MTEKRFTISIDSNDRKSIWDDERTEEEPLIALNRFGEIWGIDDCCKLLNEQHETIQELLSQIDTSATVEDDYRKHLEIYSDEYFKLKEKLSETLQEAYDQNKNGSMEELTVCIILKRIAKEVGVDLK